LLSFDLFESHKIAKLISRKIIFLSNKNTMMKLLRVFHVN